MTPQEIKEYFSNILAQNKLDKLSDYLESSDFYTAPASTKFHGAEEGGLALHSYQVGLNAFKISEAMSIEAPFLKKRDFCMILGICHDLCKVDFYKKDFKNVKDSNGNWTKVPCYVVRDDHTSYGHGMTSYMRMTEYVDNKALLDSMSIPVIYHMGNYDVGDQSVYGYGKAKNDFPWLSILQCADQLAAAINKV